MNREDGRVVFQIDEKSLKSFMPSQRVERRVAEKGFCLLELIIFKRLPPLYNQEAKRFDFLASIGRERRELSIVLTSYIYKMSKRRTLLFNVFKSKRRRISNQVIKNSVKVNTEVFNWWAVSRGPMSCPLP